MPEHVRYNELFGYRIPIGHFVVMDAKAGTAKLYNRWMPIADPERYLARYYEVSSVPPPSVA